MPKQLKLTEVLPPELPNRSRTFLLTLLPLPCRRKLKRQPRGAIVALSLDLPPTRLEDRRVCRDLRPCDFCCVGQIATDLSIDGNCGCGSSGALGGCRRGFDHAADLNAPNDADQFLATQIKLIQSDAVLRPVARAVPSPGPGRPDEQRIPEREQLLAVAPITLKRLKVTRPPNTYLLLISYRSPDRASCRGRCQCNRQFLFAPNLRSPHSFGGRACLHSWRSNSMS